MHELTPEQIDLLLANCATRELQFAVLAAADAGLRRREIEMAKPEWFDLAAGTVTVPEYAEKSFPRMVALSPRLVEFLHAGHPRKVNDCSPKIRKLAAQLGFKADLNALRDFHSAEYARTKSAQRDAAQGTLPDDDCLA